MRKKKGNLVIIQGKRITITRNNRGPDFVVLFELTEGQKESWERIGENQ